MSLEEKITQIRVRLKRLNQFWDLDNPKRDRSNQWLAPRFAAWLQHKLPFLNRTYKGTEFLKHLQKVIKPDYLRVLREQFLKVAISALREHARLMQAMKQIQTILLAL